MLASGMNDRRERIRIIEAGGELDACVYTPSMPGGRMVRAEKV
jgi:hypothetical protein